MKNYFAITPDCLTIKLHQVRLVHKSMIFRLKMTCHPLNIGYRYKLLFKENYNWVICKRGEFRTKKIIFISQLCVQPMSQYFPTFFIRVKLLDKENFSYWYGESQDRRLYPDKKIVECPNMIETSRDCRRIYPSSLICIEHLSLRQWFTRKSNSN
jgi:hypothetical protein